MKLLSVASEVYPLVKTGGLADVAGALPLALAAEGVETRTLLPGYPAVLAAVAGAPVVWQTDELMGGAARLLEAVVGGLSVLVLHAPHLFDRLGGLYGHGDDGARFGALARVAAWVGQGRVPAWRPDVVHAHDWQTALVPAYLHYDGGNRPGTVVTIHNLAFQGEFPREMLGYLGFPPEAFSIDGIEYFGAIGFLKAGLFFADRITTVSPGYADEIRTPGAGMSLDGLLRARGDALVGILNGIDTDVWNPASDSLLPERYDATDLAGRAACKAALQARFGLAADPSAPLFGVVSRLSWQKGTDLLLGCLDAVRGLGAQVAILGAGDDDLRDAIQAAATGGDVGCFIGYDERIAHLMQAGADALVVPSRFEPCGLTQLCALRYGAIPVVTRVGGLADTVIDASPMALAAGAATGVQFWPPTVEALAAALSRTVGLYRDTSAWKAMQAAGMRTDVSWRDPARRYAALYRSIAGGVPSPGS